MLTGPLYMLQVYDRVLPSRNISTLVGISVLAFMLFSFQALTDLVRSRVMVRIGTFVDGALSELAYKADLLPVAEREAGSQPTRDLDQLRSFLLSGGLLPYWTCPGFLFMRGSASCSIHGSVMPF